MEERPLITEKTTRILKDQIIRMQSSETIKIPSERDLAISLEVSRVSVRTAIKNLADEGLLTQIQGKGTYITPVKKLLTLHILCSPDIKGNDPFYNKFLVEVTSVAAKDAISIFIVNPNSISDTKELSPLITVGILDNSLLDRLSLTYKTIISIQEFTDYNNVTQIHFDDYKIGWQAAKTLLEFGCEKILHLAGPDKYPSALLRKQGFQDAMKSSKHDFLLHTEKMNWSGGYASGDFILDTLPEIDRPTGIFAANDWMAMGLIQRLKERGIRIPDDISIIGCDDIPLASELTPKLTTFNLNMKHLLMEVFAYINRENLESINFSKKILIPAQIIFRDSLICYK
jgi:DNA-binding LacI/PurR family transcriptional regulator